MIYKNEDGKWMFYSDAAGVDLPAWEFVAACALGLGTIAGPLTFKCLLLFLERMI